MRVDVQQAARGKWKSMLPELGVSATYLNGKHGPCPVCRAGTDRFRFDNKDGRGTWVCSRCGAGDGFGLVMKTRGVDFREAARLVEGLVGVAPEEKVAEDRDEAEKRRASTALWRSGTIVQAGDHVSRYLATRGIHEPVPVALRAHKRLAYAGTMEHYPAMLAEVTSADGHPVTVHRTYLAVDGSGKAPVADARRLMPGIVPRGSAIRLSPKAPMMGIAEGLETALSASALFGLPVWAAINSTLLGAWEPPREASHVVVFGDNDKSFGGQAAAYALAHRLSGRLKVEVKFPTRVGTDWNDTLMERQERLAA